MSIRRYLEDGDRMYWFPRGHSRGSHTGPELVVNGGFEVDSDWDKGAGWTISGGLATRTNTGSVTTLTQSMTLTPGAKYRVAYTIAAYTSGSVRAELVQIGVGVDASGANRAEVGTFTEILTAGASSDAFRFRGDTNFAGSIGGSIKVSVRRVG